MTSRLSSKSPDHQGKSKFAAELLFLALAYFAGGRLGLSIPYIDTHITLIWLPMGIAVAALMRWGNGCWPGIFLGALAVNYSVDASPLLDCCIALGNTLAPLLTARLLRRLKFHATLDRAYDILLFVVAAAVGMLASASSGVASLVMFDLLPVQNSGLSWLSWWAGDFVGTLLAAPLLLNISSAEMKKLWAQRTEFLVWTVIMLSTSWIVFILNNDDQGQSLQYGFMVLPLVVWSAMRFGVVGSSLGVLVPTIIVSAAVSLGHAPHFTVGIHDGLFLLWLFLATLALVNLLISAMQAGRNRADEALRLDNEFKKELIQSLPGIFYMLDASGRFLMWNRQLERVLQLGGEEITRSHPLEFFEGNDRVLIEENIRNTFVTGETTSEAVLVAKNGIKTPYYFTGRRIERNGEPVLVGMGIDISERKLSEQTTREAKERMEFFFNSTPNAVLVSRLSDGIITDFNKAFSRLSGYTKDEAIGKTTLGVNAWVNPDEHQKFMDILQAQGYCENFEAQFRKKDGSQFAGILSAGITKIQGVQHIVSSTRDITESKLIQQNSGVLLRRYQALMESAFDGIHVMDIHGNLVEANDSFCHMLGYTREEMSRMNVADWDVNWPREKLLERLRSLVHMEGTLFETRHRRKDGSFLEVEVSTTGVEIEGAHYLFASSRDITERRQSQKETEKALRRYQTLMHTALDGFRVMDIQGNVVEANDAFCRMLGYTHEETLKLNIADWDAQWSKDELLERLGSLIGKSARFETVQRRKDGTLIDVEVSTSGVEIDGQPYFFASSRDITERKRIEQKNKVLMRRHQALMKSALEGIHIMDAKGNIVEANDTYCRMLGYTQEEMAKLNVADWDVLCSSREELMERFNKLIHSGGELFESRQRRKDGSVIDVEVSCAGVELDGRYYLYASSHDITKRKDAEKTLEIARAHEAEALQELRVMLNISGEGFWKADTSGNILEVNDAYCNITGYARSEIVGAHISKFEAVEQTPAAVAKHIRRIIEIGTDRFQTRHRHRDGRLIDIEIVSSYIPETDCVITFMHDVSERKQVEEILRIAAITFDTQEGIMITDADAKILRVNQAFQDITGYGAEEVIGHNPSMFQSGRHDAAFYAAMWSELIDTGRWAGEVWDKRKNGEAYPKLLTITAAYDDRHRITHYVAVFRDISNRKKSEQEIHQLAFYDPLTGLPNRRLLLDRLQQGLAVSARNGRHGALLFLDLDHFKTINDTQGHAMGDQLLIEVARRLQSCVREGDSVARLGGDEFVVVLEDLSSDVDEAATQTETVAEKIRMELDKPYVLNDFECLTTVSVGVSLYFEHRETAEDLLRHADVAMYQAKAAGRNAIRFFDPHMQTALELRASMEADLRHALEKKQFHLCYQIQVDSLRRPLGAEVLLRWEHPEQGLVSPLQFISLAEETGLIVPIGLWVLQTACAQLKEWQSDALARELTLAVNVSAKQFRQTDFVAQVQRILLESGARPSLLKLELTESTVLENVEDTISKMQQLKLLGVSFSLDDFGTGYSSLQYLKRLPLDQIKIDQTFVRDIVTDTNDAAIVQTIIAMTAALGLQVIAEGVEVEAQRVFLDNHGCHAFQGYLFSKPIPIGQFEAALRLKQ